MARRLQRTGGRRERKFPFAALLLALSALVSGGASAADTKPDPKPCSSAPDEVRLQVSVSGLHSLAGTVAITIYPDDRKRFLASGGKLFRLRVKTEQPVTKACFALPAAGFYVVSVYHDENNDHDFKRSFIGLPAEGYGFSNNPKLVLGLPSLSEVRFETKAGDNPIEIKLSY